jgi:hypothetical protein
MSESFVSLIIRSKEVYLNHWVDLQSQICLNGTRSVLVLIRCLEDGLTKRRQRCVQYRHELDDAFEMAGLKN